MGGHGQARHCRCGTRIARDNTAELCNKCTITARDRFTTAPEVPGEFWDHEHMRQAFASCHMGMVIRAYRTHPWHGKPVRQETVARWLHLHRSQLSRVENDTDTNDLGKMTFWARQLGVPEAHLWFRLRSTASAGGHMIRRAREPATQTGTSDRSPLARGALVGAEGRNVSEASRFPPPRGSAPSAADGDVTDVEDSQRMWHTTRRHLIRNRTTLAELAKDLYDPSWLLPGTPVLTTDAWLPEQPIPLADVVLEWESDAPAPIILGQEPQLRPTLPLRATGQPFPNYSSAIRYLSPPTLFENRPCYRLLDATLNASSGSVLRFGQASYFDKIDVSEALGHELAAAAMRSAATWANLPLRSLMADPFDLSVRTVNTSITTLTIRADSSTGDATFFLLRRDPRNVVTGGGEYGVIPAGEFQPASIAPSSLCADLDLWRNIVREYSEEFLGQPEHDGSGGRPLDYDAWPFYRAMQRARTNGELGAWVLGITFNALSLNATILTATVIDSVTFDRLFRGMTAHNTEGEIVTTRNPGGSAHGIPFERDTVQHFLDKEELLAPQAAAALTLAWRHHDLLRLHPGPGRP